MKLENRGLFTIEGYDRNFTGYSNEKDNWNGWACPYFELEDALEVLETMEGVRFHHHRKLSDGGHVLCWLDDDEEMHILESEVIETSSGEEVEVFGVGVCQWCWQGVNCDPERPGLAASKEMLVEALVENSTSLQNYYCVTLQKNGLDADWWAVYESDSKKDCESVAEQINKAFARFGLTK